MDAVGGKKAHLLYHSRAHELHHYLYHLLLKEEVTCLGVFGCGTGGERKGIKIKDQFAGRARSDSNDFGSGALVIAYEHLHTRRVYICHFMIETNISAI